MKFKELLEKDVKELSEMYINLKRSYMQFRIAMSSPTEGFKPSVVRACKKDIARVKTRLRQIKDKK